MSMTFHLTLGNGTKVEVPEELLNGMGLEDIGYCTVCGDERCNTEPDAENYPCEGCGRNTVFGAQQLLLMGRIE